MTRRFRRANEPKDIPYFFFFVPIKPILLFGKTGGNLVGGADAIFVAHSDNCGDDVNINAEPSETVA